ncbi:MAG: hypothetical protein ACTTKL_05155 [Treponema sp.]
MTRRTLGKNFIQFLLENVSKSSIIAGVFFFYAGGRRGDDWNKRFCVEAIAARIFDWTRTKK